jgi:hypothetical protein
MRKDHFPYIELIAKIWNTGGQHLAIANFEEWLV